MWYTILTNQRIKNMIISIDAEQAFDKIHHPFMIKTLQKVGIEGTHLNIVKAIMTNPQQISFLMVKNWKHFLKEQKRDGCPLLTILFNLVLGVLSKAIREEKEIKGVQIRKEEVKLSLFADDMILCIETPKWKWKSLSRVQLFVTPWTIQSMEFSRPE